MKTIFITGSSSGIGKSTAIYFANKGWNVAATMRNPEKETELNKIKNIRLYKLDVNNEESIVTAKENALKYFGEIDVLFNNAGYAAIGIFEESNSEIIQQQFDTNVFGVMRVTRAFLPYFRNKNAGTIITTTSVAGLISFPLYSLYNSSKWAVEGFMEGLRYELRQFNIKIKCVEPGAIKTDFYDRSRTLMDKGMESYEKYKSACFFNTDKIALSAPGPIIIAKKVFQAANSKNYRLRYARGTQANLILFLRRILPSSWFFGLVRIIVEKGFRKKRNSTS